MYCVSGFPLITGATLLIGLFGGMSIQSHPDSTPAASPTPTAVQSDPRPEVQENTGPVGNPKRQRHTNAIPSPDAVHEQ